MTSEKIKTKLTIVIVYYGGYKDLLSLLNSLKNDDTNFPYEIIVVNNNADEKIGAKIQEKFKEVTYMESSGNIGYGRGNNLGAGLAKGKYLFIINPDTKIKKGTVKVLTDFLDQNKNAAIVAPNLTDTEGKLFEKQGTRILTPLRAIFSLTIFSKIFPRNKIIRDYYMMDVPKNSLREVDVVPGTAFMIRKKIFVRVGRFDPNFFLYFEEFDLCKRVKEAGWNIYITPNGIVEHDWNPGDGGKELKKYFMESRLYYFKKHYGLLNALIVEIFCNVNKWYLIIFFAFLLLLCLFRFLLPEKY